MLSLSLPLLPPPLHWYHCYCHHYYQSPPPSTTTTAAAARTATSYPSSWACVTFVPRVKARATGTPEDQVLPEEGKGEIIFTPLWQRRVAKKGERERTVTWMVCMALLAPGTKSSCQVFSFITTVSTTSFRGRDSLSYTQFFLSLSARLRSHTRMLHSISTLTPLYTGFPTLYYTRVPSSVHGPSVVPHIVFWCSLSLKCLE